MNQKSIYLLLILSILFPFAVMGQNENNVWTFGHNTGLNFNTNPPTFFQSSQNVMEGSASVSDASGNLLFYTTGFMVYDKFGNPMPNASGMLGNSPTTGTYMGSSRQGVAIVKNPQNPDQYYIFCSTPLEDAPNFYLYYSIVDMTLNGGLGNVTAVKNYILTTGTDEAIKMVRHSSCNSFWLLTTTFGTNKSLRAFAITGSGINPTPVTTVLPYGIANNQVASTHNDSLLLLTGNAVYTYDFNKTTGQLSNPQTFSNPGFPPDFLEFSADGSKLYGCANNSGAVTQWDFSLWPNVTAVGASATDVYSGSTIFGSIRRGPNGKIYLKANLNNSLSVINNPNASGAACNFAFSGLPLPVYAQDPSYNVANFLELGNTYVPPTPPDTIRTVKDSTHCFASVITLKVDTGYTGYSWNTGAATSSINVTLPGTYWVSRFKNCKIYVDSFHILGQQKDTMLVSSKDTTLCGTAVLSLLPAGTYTSYLWSTGNTGPAITVQQPGLYCRFGTQGCHVYADSFSIQFLEGDTLQRTVDTVVCFGTSATLAPGAGYDFYYWNDGSTAPSLAITQDGLYLRKAYTLCDARYDTFHVRFIDFDFDLGEDTSFCPGEIYTLGASVPGASYRWQDGSATQQYTVTREGLYRLRVSVDVCSLTDSVYVSYLLDPSLLLAQEDTSVCSETPLRLRAIATGQGAYLWNTGAVTASIDVTKAGTYIVTYTDPCAILSDSVTITEFDCHCTPFVPNAFSPNGDGHNDKFEVRLDCPLKAYEFRIYNRYGEMVFKSNTPGEGWDGIYKGTMSDVSTYFYYLVYTGYNNKAYQKKGDLTLLR